MGMKVYALAALLLGGCLRMESIDCGDFTCPANTECAVEHEQCVTAAQATVCDTLDEGRACTADGNPGICNLGYCISGCGDGVQDMREECDDGNFASHDGCSSTCLLESLSWREVHDPWTPITSPAVAHLARNGGTLVRFGGYAAEAVSNAHWERNDGTWRQRTTGLLPSPRHYMAYGYDAARDVMVIFGGTEGGTNRLDETWEYDGTAWTQITTIGKPTPRYGAAMAFDDARDVFVLFGGFDPTTITLFSDTWEYTPSTKTWTQITPLAPAPSARFWHAMTWDATAQRIVLFGGIGGDRRAWRYDGTNRWVAITNIGPTQRASVGLAYSPDTGRVTLFGGRRSTIETESDTWELETLAGTWTQLGVTLSPPGRYEHAMAYDPERSSVVLFGGFTGYGFFDDAWELSGDRWTEVTPRYAPENGQIVNIAYDSARARTVAYSFDRLTGASTLWEFDGAMWTRPPSAARPRRSHYSIAYDAVRSRTVMFGGLNAANALQQTTWEWDGVTWNDPTPPTMPPARYFGAMAQAGPTGGVLVFGGFQNTSSSELVARDTWVFDGSTWREVSTPDAIPAAGVPMLAYDAKAERVILLTHLGATWAFQNDTWTQLFPAESPPARAEGALVFRRDRGKVLLYGGRGYSDVWELDDDTWRKLELIGELPPYRVFAGAAYHESVRGFVLYGGGTLGGGALEDTWLLGYSSETDDEICGNTIDDDDDFHTDEDDPDCMY